MANRAVFAILIIVVFIAPVCNAATINVDNTTELTSFNYRKLLGNNTGDWIAPNKYMDNSAKIASSGCYFERFPGGSISDQYHWNGSGSYDANQVWHPDTGSYLPGFRSNPTHMGSIPYVNWNMISVLTDGDGSSNSQWISETITAASATTNAYCMLMLGAHQPVDAVRIFWGDVYATDYEVQYWNDTEYYYWGPHAEPASLWTTALAVTGGTGGVDNRTIPSTTARYFRILMCKSSAAGYKVNEIMLFNGAAQVTSNVNSAAQTGTLASPTNAGNQPNTEETLFDFESFMTFINSLGPKAEAVCTVNFGTGTPEEAAAWVYYANVLHGYNVKYWQIGNEQEGAWEVGGPSDAEYYARRFIKYAEAMKAVDPAIKICGPVAADYNNGSGLYNGKSFMESFLAVLQADGKMDLLDVLDFHIYASGSTDESWVLSSAGNWFGGRNYKGFVDNLLATYCGGVNSKEVLLSEHNSGSTLPTMSFVNSLWVVNWLCEYARAFGPRAYANFFNIMTKYASAGDYDLGYLEVGQQTGAYKYQERGAYWGMYMMNNYFVAQDDFGNTLIAASSDAALLKVYANKRSDTKLSVMVLNEDNANQYETGINISGYSPDPSAEVHTFAANAMAPYYIQNYLWHEANPLSYADPDLAPAGAVINYASNSFSFTFAPYSITVFEFVPIGSSPTMTPTISPTFSHSPVHTPTVTPTPQQPPNFVNAECAQGASFVIDGNLDDAPWQAGTWTGVTRVTEGASGVVSAVFMVKWDASALYAGVDVTDPALCNFNTDWWQDDGVEIYIDANNDHTAVYGTDDFEFTKRYGDPVTREAYGHLGGVTAATYQTVTGYSVEFRIPWPDLGKTPSASLSMGFDVGINHNEACGTVRDGVLMWNGNGNNWQSTIAFGDAYLQACADTPTSSPTVTSTFTGSPTPAYTEAAANTYTATPSMTPTLQPSASNTVTPTWTAVIPLYTEKIEMFPVPCRESINIYITAAGNGTDATVCIYTQAFRMIRKSMLRLNNGVNVISFPAEGLANGYYIAAIKLEDAAGIRKRIIQFIVLK